MVVAMPGVGGGAGGAPLPDALPLPPPAAGVVALPAPLPAAEPAAGFAALPAAEPAAGFAALPAAEPPAGFAALPEPVDEPEPLGSGASCHFTGMSFDSIVMTCPDFCCCCCI